MKYLAIAAMLILSVWLSPSQTIAQTASSGVVQGVMQPDVTTRELLAIMNERERANGQRFDAQEKAVSAALAAAKEAVGKAEAAAEKRFDSVNEFRNTLKDQQQTLLPRAEATVQFKNVHDKLDATEKRLTLIQGQREGADWLWGVVLGLAGLLVGVAAAFGVMRSRPNIVNNKE